MSRAGLSFVEILVAVFVMAVMLLPLVGLVTQGFRDTQATIDEVIATNLASEIVEQLDALPFGALPPEATGSTVTLDSAALLDGAEVTAGSKCHFHLSPLPAGFTRELVMSRPRATLREAVVTVRWAVANHPRSLTMRRMLSKDEILPAF